MMPRATAIMAVILMLAMSLSGCLFWEDEGSDDHVRLITCNDNRVDTHETNLYGIGPRLTGTEEEYSAARYIRDEFEDSGLSNVRIEWYNVTCYEVNDASFKLVSYNPTTGQESDSTQYIHMTDFILQGYSGSRDWSDRLDDLEIVDVGNGSDASAYDDVDGKAVIVTTDFAAAQKDFSLTDLFVRAWENGAEANIIHNLAYHPDLDHHPISFTAGGEIDGHMVPLHDTYPEGQGPDIPSFMVSKSVGDEIKTKLESQTINQMTGESNVKVQIDFDVTIEERALNVVISEVPGKGDGLVLLGAHHDSVYVTPGAQDNTCGVATLLEIARNLVGTGPKQTIRFATWGGEEEALMGSWEYIKANMDVLDELTVYINLDMVNVELSKGASVTMMSNDERFTSKLKKVQRAVVDKYGWAKKYDFHYKKDNLTGSSDQASFTIEGADAVVYWGSGSVGYHTPLDDLSHIYKESLMLCGIILGSFALMVANGG